MRSLDRVCVLPREIASGLRVSIVKATRQLLGPHGLIERLELCARKPACTVLRGAGDRKVICLPDKCPTSRREAPDTYAGTRQSRDEFRSRKTVMPRSSSSSRITSSFWRRSIHGEIALRKRDFISLRAPVQLSNGAHGASWVVGGSLRRTYSAKLTALSSTFLIVPQGAPSA